MKYFVRLSQPYAVLEDVIRRMGDQAKALVCYEHSEKADNVHVHIYIDTTLKSDALKVRLKKVYMFQKTEWSFVTANDDNCIVYMSKGKLEPSYVKGYTQQEIDEFRGRWEVRASPDKKDSKTGPTQFQIAQEIRDLTPEIEDTLELYSQLVRNAITVHLKHKKAFSEFSLDKTVTTAFAMYHKGRCSIVQRMVGKFSKYGI